MSFKKSDTVTIVQTIRDPSQQYRLEYRPSTQEIFVVVETDQGQSFGQSFQLSDSKLDQLAMASLKQIADDCISRILKAQGFAEVPPEDVAVLAAAKAAAKVK